MVTFRRCNSKSKLSTCATSGPVWVAGTTPTTIGWNLGWYIWMNNEPRWSSSQQVFVILFGCVLWYEFFLLKWCQNFDLLFHGHGIKIQLQSIIFSLSWFRNETLSLKVELHWSLQIYWKFTREIIIQHPCDIAWKKPLLAEIHY